MPEAHDQSETLDPRDAFASLGNETRMSILRTLGAATDPVPFSDLRGRVGVEDSGQFNYHLGELVGHFVRKTDDGYELRQAGRRVVQAVLSGAVTETPVLEPTQIAQPCPYCGAPIEVTFRQERLLKYCTECPGASDEPASTGEPSDPSDEGYLGALTLPPAGVEGRTAPEVYETAWTWGNVEFLTDASGICPRCSAPLEQSVTVCEDHDHADTLCEACGRRHAVQYHSTCTNCIYRIETGPVVLALVAETELLAFLTEHGLNPVSPSAESIVEIDRAHMDYDEEVRSVDPFEAEFTFSVDDDALSVVVDDDLDVVEARRK